MISNADYGQLLTAAGSQDVDMFIDALISSLPPIYEKEERDHLLIKLYECLAEELVRADICLESVQNDNLILVEVIDEYKKRGFEDRDRLENENACELDEIRFKPSTEQSEQRFYLNIGDNKIYLNTIPKDNNFYVTFDNGLEEVEASLEYTFNSIENSLNFTNVKTDGKYSVSYLDTGDVLEFREQLYIPNGLFELGWNEGMWNSLGYSE